MQGKYDAFLFVDYGLHFGKVHPEHHWRERMRPIFKNSHSMVAYNIHDSHLLTSPFQAGGSGITLGDNLNARKTGTGADPTGLGRWAWSKVVGKGEFTTIVVAAYRPTNNRRDPGSVWNQHRRYFLAKGEDREPIAAFDQDLLMLIANWIEEGSNIIIGIDANDDVRCGVIAKKLQSLGMTETVTQHHNHLSPPATQNRNRSRTPIDGIWATGGIEVIKAGYTAFGGACPSDHRGLWIDVSTASTLGHRPPRILQPVEHRLHSKDPRIWRKYCNLVVKEYDRQNVPNMATQLQMLCLQQNPVDRQKNTESIIALHSKIHDSTRLIRQEVARNIRKVKRGEVPWSPRLQALRNDIELWDRVVKLHEGKATSRTIIRRLARRCGKIQEVEDSGIDEAIEALKKAHSRYKSAKPDSHLWRSEHLHGLADALADQNNSTRAIELKKMITVENQRQQGRAARRLRGKAVKKTVTKVTYRDSEERTIEACDPETIANACAASNLLRQHRCVETPFLQPPLLGELGYLADTEAADRILDGSYESPEGLDQYTRAFIRELATPECIRTQGCIDITVSHDEHRKAWKQQKDRTASEPTGLSFSHYRSSIHDDTIVTIDTLLRGLPLQLGFAPKQWCNITDIEILKKANTYDVDQMRLIQLMDAEFNMNNKMIGRRMMSNAESLGLIPHDQYGSRKHHSSVTAALNKRLTMDIWRQKRQSGAIAMIDAQGCFDRIAHPVASLTLQRFGVPRTAVQCLYKVLQQAQHRIATGYGVSEPKYGGPDQIPPVQGEGQGNGKAPATWVLISSIIIQMMYTAGFGVNMITAISTVAVSFVCFAFVDDTDIIHTGPLVDTPGETIITQFQQAMDCWEGGLRASGGALVPGKSFWYLIDWQWDGQKWSYVQLEDLPGDIYVRSTDGQGRQALRRFNPDHAEPTLGIYLAMDGNERAQISYLQSKVQDFTDSLRVHKSTKNDAWYAMTRSFQKTIEYPIAVTTISQKMWSSIMSPAINALLPKAGLSSKFPRDVLFGPSDFQGFGLSHPWYLQEITHMVTLLTEMANNTQTGLLLRATIEQLHMEIGIAGNLGEINYSTFQHLATPSWIKSVWSTLSQFQMAMHLSSATIPLLRKHDCYLMETFAQHGYRGSELQRLNICRMFLRATTLADIATIDGKTISSSAFQGKQSNRIRPYLQWPRQPTRLGPDYWTLWQRALVKCFTIPQFATNLRRLQMPLGDWEISTIDLHKVWQQMYSPTYDKLYRRSGLYWKIADTTGRRQSGRRKRFTFYGMLTRELPSHANMLASTYKEGASEVLEGELVTMLQSQAPPTSPDKSGIERLQSLLNDETVVVDEVALPLDNCTRLVAGIQNGEARAVSDGSFKDSYGTAAGIMTSAAEDDDALLFVTSVPGSSEDQSSYRSELAGILGVLQILEALCTTYQIQAGSITIALDGMEAMRQASYSNLDAPLKAGQNSFDILLAIRTTRDLLPITVHWKWVEGHQSEKGKPMDWWARKNHTADSLAKQYWTSCQRNRVSNRPRKLRNETLSIHIQGIKLSRLHMMKTYAMLYGPKTIQYWSEKTIFSTQQVGSIMWPEAQQSLLRLPFGLQRFWLKFATGFLGTGRKQRTRGFQTDDNCPRCGMEDENNVHVLRCPTQAATSIWNSNMQALLLELQRLHTAPAIAKAIIHNLQAWHSGTTPYIPTTNRWGERDAALAQNQIGWTNFVFGRWHRRWAMAQSQYLKFHESRRNSKRWTTAIIYKLYMTAWDLWDHRNKTLHAPTGPKAAAETASLTHHITNEHSKGLDGLHRTDYHLMSRTLTEILGGSRSSQRKWLYSIRLARQPHDANAIAGLNTLQQQQSLMRRWLQGAQR